MRFVADCIDMNHELYDQNTFGGVGEDHRRAGTGTSCGTAACSAGFIVQFLGNSERLQEIKVNIYLEQGPIGKVGVQKYAEELINIPQEWGKVIFQTLWWGDLYGKKKIGPTHSPFSTTSIQNTCSNQTGNRRRRSCADLLTSFKKSTISFGKKRTNTAYQNS